MTAIELDRPRRAPWVVVHTPMSDDAPWIVERPQDNPLRVSGHMAALLRVLDGERDVVELAALLGDPWTPQIVLEVVERFSAMGLVLEPESTPPPPEKRFVAHSIVVLRLRLIRAARVLEPFRAVLEGLPGRRVLAVSCVVAAFGVLSLAFAHSAVGTVLGRPLPLDSWVTIWVGLAAVTVVHELGHGATLVHYRGRPGWLGVMLFYLSPACFCEVTDGWRLARPRQRVMVALAGVITQAAVAGVVAVVGVLLPTGETRTTVVAFSVVVYGTALVNLAPWIRLDGYLALMSYLDIPMLRDKAMADARAWLGGLVFGLERTTYALPRPALGVPYGLLCLGFPALVLGLVLSRWARELANLGPAGAAIKLALLAGILGWLVLRVHRVVRGARTRGASSRRCLLAGAVAVGVLALVASVPVHRDVRGGFLRDTGVTQLAVPSTTDTTDLAAGQEVVLYRQGLLLREEVGHAVVADGVAHRGSAPAEALIPVRSPAPVEALRLDLEDVSIGVGDEVGGATVRGPRQPLGVWFVDTELLSAVRTVLPQLR